MSRHRNIINVLKNPDDDDDFDDYYGRSLEDDNCISPSDAQQFMFDRNKPTQISLFMDKDEDILEEDVNLDVEENRRKSSDFKWPELNPTDEARLRSCLEEIRNVIGDHFPASTIINTILENDYDFAKSLNTLLTKSKDSKLVHHQASAEIKDLKQYLESSQNSKFNLGNSSEKQFKIPNLKFNSQNDKLNFLSDSDEEDNGFSSFMTFKDKHPKSSSPLSTNPKQNSKMICDFDNISKSIDNLPLAKKEESSENITSLSDLVSTHLSTKKQKEDKTFFVPFCKTESQTSDSTDGLFIKPNFTHHADIQPKIESQETFSKQNQIENPSKWTIDLSSALNNSIYNCDANKSEQKTENIERSSNPKQGIFDNLNISFIANNSPNSQNISCSSFGKILCKHWEYKKVKIKKKKRLQHKFKFNNPSPDDRRKNK